MIDRGPLDLFLEKVPDLRTARGVAATVGYVVTLTLGCILFFLLIDSVGPHAPLLSQLLMAIVVVTVGYLHLDWSTYYRLHYEDMAYCYFFYHFMVPYLVTWYSCIFHPFFIDGPQLLPQVWAVAIGTAFVLMGALVSVHIERAGFSMITHGMDVYTVFPDEATAVRGGIYDYIRHPLYFALMCVGLGLGFLRNNGVALAAACMQVIPALAVAMMEDDELIDRYGEAHAAYIGRTATMLPRKRLGRFLLLLFFFARAEGDDATKAQ